MQNVRACRRLAHSIAFLLGIGCQVCGQTTPSVFQLNESALPLKASRTISFRTTEGSFMNLDISPDGKSLLFDLLGDIYTIPATGGKARQLTKGLSLNAYPVFSPDGKFIAFSSDASGDNQLYIATTATGRTKRITNYPPRVRSGATEPIWGPGGQTLIAPQSIFYLAGGEVVKKNIDQQIGLASDGTSVYYSRVLSNNILVLKSDVLQKKTDTALVLPKVGPINLRISPDGKWLCYMNGGGNGNFHLKGLNLYDLTTKTEKHILDFNLPMTTLLPVARYCFSPDSKSVFISYDGKIRNITLETGKNTIIPFDAEVNVAMASLNKSEFPVTNTFHAKYCRWVQLRKDEKQLLFSALGRLYVKSMPNGVPRLLVPQQDCEQGSPAYSPDGKWVAYATWSDTGRGNLWRVPAEGGTPELISSSRGLYMHPSWSPDQKRLVVMKGKPMLGNRNTPGAGAIEIIDLNDKSVRSMADSVPMYNDPSFSTDGSTIYYIPKMPNKIGPTLTVITGLQWPQLVSHSLQTGKIDTIALVGDAGYGRIRQIKISPDKRNIVFVLNENLYMVPILDNRASAVLYDTSSVLPVIRFAEGGIDPHWVNGGKDIRWNYGGNFYTAKLSNIYENVADSLFSTTRINKSFIVNLVKPERVYPIELAVEDMKGKGTIAFVNGKVVTMNGMQVIENGTVIVQNGKIIQVGPHGQVRVPDDAKVYDVSGKTLIPGLIDMHSHMYFVPPDVFAEQSWEFISNLAYGVTTARDPSGSFDTYGYSEIIRSGRMTGPRLFTVSDAVRTDFNPVTNAYDAATIVSNRKKMGGMDVKQYMLRTRVSRQYLLQACRQQGLNMTNEVIKEPLGFIGMLKDGSTGVEHNPVFSNAKSDLIKFVALSGTYLTPTLFQNYEGYMGENFLHAYHRQHPDERYAKFVPQSALDVVFSDTMYDGTNKDFVHNARVDSAIFRNGGNIVIGSHGEHQAITMHYEMWALKMGGLTNHDVLQAATINGARALGMQKDLGSIEPGKIADLIVLDKNPLDDIHYSNSIRFIMKDGVLYDAETMDIVWPFKKPMQNKGMTKGFSGATAW